MGLAQPHVKSLHRGEGGGRWRTELLVQRLLDDKQGSRSRDLVLPSNTQLLVTQPPRPHLAAVAAVVARGLDHSLLLLPPPHHLPLGSLHERLPLRLLSHRHKT